MITSEVEKRAIAFIRTVGNRCMVCLRRSDENCSNCISRWANSILRDIDKSAPVDYSLAARMMLITDALANAEGPLGSHEIDLRKYCTPQLKRWTLLRMVAKGKIKRTVVDPGAKKPCYRYELITKETTK
ncbi:MAG: hypothetical protein J6V72_19895 [Kiritimatiellae bacterium]|nr:hypothetical protein [Kiritimatiellia bacterium]